jgi:hypothetical protein
VPKRNAKACKDGSTRKQSNKKSLVAIKPFQALSYEKNQALPWQIQAFLTATPTQHRRHQKRLDYKISTKTRNAQTPQAMMLITMKTQSTHAPQRNQA